MRKQLVTLLATVSLAFVLGTGVAQAAGLTTLTATNIPSGHVITITLPTERCPSVAAQLKASGEFSGVKCA